MTGLGHWGARVSIFVLFIRRMDAEAITRPKEVMMHPMMIRALADEVARDRTSESTHGPVRTKTDDPQESED